MTKNYHPQEIEKKWLEKWEKKPPYQAIDFDKKNLPTGRQGKFYGLAELPYLSGEGLHIGHVFTFTIQDIVCRQKRMAGFNVLHPMGWDAFGLPTENTAIKTGIHPIVLTARNSSRFREQIKRIALSYNWDREIDTSDPKYYRWTQWIFLQLFKHGLAYKAETPVGWCPKCKIILANEEIVGGNCERCGAPAEYRRQKQWLLKITAYADRLADELDLVDYPSYVKKSQRDWIGRTEGVIIEYPVFAKASTGKPNLTISCYSTRPDTNFGATFVVIAPEHPLVAKLTTKENLKKVSEYIKRSKSKSEMERTDLAKEKTGVFTGSYALNRLNGKKMPIWVSDFVVLTAGTGMVVGVPAHDQRDWEFAKKYGLGIIPVIKPAKGSWDFEKAPFLEIDQAEVYNSDFLNGLPTLKAKDKIIDFLVKKGWGKKAKNYHLRDWIFSRQHYWGEPIPIIHCPKCGIVPVPEDQLPLKLPKVEKYQPTDTGESPLAKIENWVNVACTECGEAARRETDTMPNWAGSCWYFLRYIDPKNNECLADYKKLQYWLPVDLYLGGAEHTTLHVLYSRFWYKFLSDLKLVPGKEPYAARRQHGVILGEDGYRMSKSRGNVVNPDEVVDKFGADTLRLYLMFMGPYDSTMPWSTNGLEGCFRFLSRIWRIFQPQSKKIISQSSPELVGELNRVIKKVGEDIVQLKHNTAIAVMMEFLNQWSTKGGLSKKDAGDFLKILAPLAPYLTEELWSNLGNKYSIHQQSWPKYDPRLINKEKVVIIIQVNGKVRGQIQVQSSKFKVQSEIEKLAKQEPRIVKYLSGKKVQKVIFVPGRLINFVI